MTSLFNVTQLSIVAYLLFLAYAAGILTGMVKKTIPNQHNNEEELPKRFKGSERDHIYPSRPSQELLDAEAADSDDEDDD